MSENAFRFQPPNTRDARLQAVEQLRQAVLQAGDYELRRAWHVVMNFIEDEAKEYENTKRSTAGSGRQRRARIRSATARSLQNDLNRVFRLEPEDEDDYDEEF